ncbi:hypothetical protein HaLaN_09959 [Haematococcus lacustris]|uniref:Uncharacterized protein n=1 Tax=Haematococcus lacustris TaxID=44745 RepID=A0A699Z3Q3_HAELA|nr:hypothetical protein HaLaN_09959 [Haematococcus lacustris]
MNTPAREHQSMSLNPVAATMPRHASRCIAAKWVELGTAVNAQACGMSTGRRVLGHQQRRIPLMHWSERVKCQH